MQHPLPPWPLEGGHAMLDAALRYAAAGLPVFPCRPDKKPLVAWRTEASTDEARVREWWTRWPDAMIGLVTGQRSNLYVVDIDVEGMVEYLALNLPKAEIAVRTPSGGGHAYFRWPGPGWGNTASRFVHGVDTRGEGGYVIAPPSCGSAGPYRWVADGMEQRLLRGTRRTSPRSWRSTLWSLPSSGLASAAGLKRRSRASLLVLEAPRRAAATMPSISRPSSSARLSPTGIWTRRA